MACVKADLEAEELASIGEAGSDRLPGPFCVGNQGSSIFKEKVPDKPLMSLGAS